MELAASKKKIRLPPGLAVDAQIDLNLVNGACLLPARLNVRLPGLDSEVAKELIHAAHESCPYSKATHSNIAVETNLL